MMTNERLAEERLAAEPMPLHLPDLYIEGFRGIDNLTIPRLGRVTLLAGKNGIGKSTVLDAVRVYAARGNAATLSDMLRSREEVVTDINEEGDPVSATNAAALFYGRIPSEGTRVSIGSEGSGTLTLTTTLVTDSSPFADIARFSPYVLDGVWYALKATIRKSEWVVPWLFSDEGISVPRTLIRPRPLFANRKQAPRRPIGAEESSNPVKCEVLGPGLPNNVMLARLWDNAVNEGEDGFAKESLEMMFGDVVESVYMVGEARELRSGRRAVVRTASNGFSSVAPLKSLGDGALRLYSVALALMNSKNGFLLIDEAENGLHYSIQRGFWRMVLQTAQANNVQVIATTHSWDCILGFAEAATENKDVEGVLYRLSRKGGPLRAVEYDEEALAITSRQRIEVR